METFPQAYQLQAEEELENSDEDFLDSVPKDVPKDVPAVSSVPKVVPKVVPKEKSKNQRFRLQGKKFLLTYPQCDVKKEVAVARLKLKWPTQMMGYVVCEEAHQDGTPHLHVFIQFKDKQTFCGENYMDFIAEKHGNYKGVTSVRGSINYCIKGSNYLVEGFDVEAILQKKGPKSSAVAKMILEGKTIQEINEVDPGYVMMNKRKLEEYESWVAIENHKKSKTTWIPPSLEGLTDSNKQIAQWICSLS